MNRFNLRSRKLALVAAKAVYSVAWLTCGLRKAARYKTLARARANAGYIFKLFVLVAVYLLPVLRCPARSKLRRVHRRSPVHSTAEQWANWLSAARWANPRAFTPSKQIAGGRLTFENLPLDGQQQGHRSEEPIVNFIHVDCAVVASTPGRGVNWQLLNPCYTFY